MEYFKILMNSLFVAVVCLGATFSEGKNLVLIPGLGQSSSVFDALEKEVQDDFNEVIKVNLPWNDASFDWGKENVVEIIDKNISHLEGPTVILGWSLGATIATEYTLHKQGERDIAKLVLVGGIYEWTGKFPPHREFPNHLLSNVEAQRRSGIRDFSLGFGLDKLNTMEIEKEMLLKTNAVSLGKAVGFMVQEGPSIVSKLQNIKAHITFIHGNHDQLVNYKGATFAHEQVKNSSLVLVECGHAPFLENPKSFASRIL